MKLRHWRYLGGRKQNPTLLAVTFDTGQGDARFADLAVNLPDYAVLELLPPTPAGGLDRLPAPDAQLATWCAELRDAAVVVHGVMGYCAGAALAAPLAAAVAAGAPDPPPAILIDPSPVVPQTLYWPFVAATDSLAGQLPAEADHARSIARKALQDAESAGPAGLTTLAVTLAEQYADLLAQAAGRLRLDDTLVAQLRDRLTAYAGYLLTAAAYPDRPDGAAMTLLSQEHPAGGTAAPTTTGRTHRLELPRTRLLAGPEAAAAVRDAVAGPVRSEHH
ncbi:hypothetical protein AB0H83_44530 [Dactylosporangium sp. NPDC050688]|uniref:hypothetical protein n=1 Tax=Dactylosporangium sp. NPDC050688 TaxID=3157217 RepID=UPI0033EE20BB